MTISYPILLKQRKGYLPPSADTPINTLYIHTPLELSTEDQLLEPYLHLSNDTTTTKSSIYVSTASALVSMLLRTSLKKTEELIKRRGSTILIKPP